MHFQENTLNSCNSIPKYELKFNSIRQKTPTFRHRPFALRVRKQPRREWIRSLYTGAGAKQKSPPDPITARAKAADSLQRITCRFLQLHRADCCRAPSGKCLNQIFGIFAVGIISTLPVPRYTFTSPSPEAAEPIRLLPDRSTVNSRPALQAIA